MRDFAFPVPFLVICELLGLPDDERDTFRALASARFDVTKGGAGAFGAISGSREYLMDFTRRQRIDPGDGLVGQIIREHGDEIDDFDLAGLADGVFTGGLETSASMLALGTAVLLEHPEHYRRLASDPGTASAVVEELLRYLGVVQVAFPRFAKADMEVAGRRIRAGDVVMCHLAAAGRDPRVGADDRFDPHREVAGVPPRLRPRLPPLRGRRAGPHGAADRADRPRPPVPGPRRRHRRRGVPAQVDRVRRGVPARPPRLGRAGSARLMVARSHHELLVVGGGNAGISLAARLLRDGAPDVAVIESQPVHRYRPLLNYVGAGEATMASLEKPADEVVPDGCTSIRTEVVAVELDGPAVLTSDGRRISCTTLVVCPGLEEDWEATPGLRECYAGGWGGSTFVVETAPHVWPTLRELSAGRVVFTVPPEPAPCGATALKPLFMACDHWQRAGVLEDLDVTLVLPDPHPSAFPPRTGSWRRRWRRTACTCCVKQG